MEYDSIEQYIVTVLAGFEEDPADSEFQYGYKACLEETLEEIQRQKRKHLTT